MDWISIQKERVPGHAVITIPGCGTRTAAPGTDGPIMIDSSDGRLRLFVWGDINQEDPTQIIDLSGALESNRLPF